MFEAEAAFRDRSGRLAGAWPDDGRPLELVPTAGLDGCEPIVAVDDLPGAADVYGSRLRERTGRRAAVVVGNERRGIGGDLRAAAHQAVRIPMAAGPLNCLNVAAAAAVALYYLAGPSGRGRMAARPSPARHRPELLLAAPGDPVEAGSSIRSAACFGWRRVLLADDEKVWFGVDRHTITQGRAAARRARNPISVVPVTADRPPSAFERVVVVTTEPGGPPLHQVDLARGDQLVVVPDGDGGAGWEGAGRRAITASLDVRAGSRFRLLASIVLAEVARQVGRPARVRSRRPAGPARRPSYDLAIRFAGQTGELVAFQELLDY